MAAQHSQSVIPAFFLPRQKVRDMWRQRTPDERLQKGSRIFEKRPDHGYQKSFE